MHDPDELVIARLREQVATLEAALARRSNEIRALQSRLGARQLISVGRVCAGHPPLPSGAYEPQLWRESSQFRKADVEVTLLDLWASLAPPANSSVP